MITAKEYGNLDMAYQHFNSTLFDGELPDCIITLNRKKGTRGYFHYKKFISRDESKRLVSEIALNPDEFIDRSNTEILSTLVHEMVHLWQYYSDVPCRVGYHDKTFAAKMKEVGLQPSSDGTVDGKETGQKMTHYIIQSGKFDQFCEQFLDELQDGLNWNSAPDIVEPKGKRKSSRAKFTCPDCGQNAWAKHEARLACGDCQVALETEEEPLDDPDGD